MNTTLKMPEPTVFKGDYHSGAIFSRDEKYRYILWRRWKELGPMVMFIGLNPSTADETKNDPTITRCINYAKRWRYRGIFMANIFAFRNTYPEVLRETDDPVGIDCDFWLEYLHSVSAMTVCAWGNHGAFMDRGKAVEEILESWDNRLHCLDMTKKDFPIHPLYQRSDKEPMRMRAITFVKKEEFC